MRLRQVHLVGRAADRVDGCLAERHQTPPGPHQLHDIVGESVLADVYEKEAKGSIMVFVVTETVWRDQTGEPVVTERFNLIHRRKAA